MARSQANENDKTIRTLLHIESPVNAVGPTNTDKLGLMKNYLDYLHSLARLDKWFYRIIQFSSLVAVSWCQIMVKVGELAKGSIYDYVEGLYG